MADQTPEELKQKFWKHLRSEQTVMLGLPGKAAGRPMTAILRKDEEHGPLWFFTSKETDLGDVIQPTKAELVFVSKNHSMFGTAHGTLTADMDRALIDELWNPYVAAWFEGGKDDPKLALVRFDGHELEIWENVNSLLAGAKMMLGMGDPKKEESDHNANVKFG